MQIVTRDAKEARALTKSRMDGAYRFLKREAHRSHRHAARMATHNARLTGEYEPREVRSLTGWEIV